MRTWRSILNCHGEPNDAPNAQRKIDPSRSTTAPNPPAQRGERCVGVFLGAALFLLSLAGVRAQNITNYSFTTTTGGTLVNMAGAITLVNSNVDDAPGAGVAMGMTFPYEAATYTHISASPDGFVRLQNNTTAATSQFSNSITSTTNIPKIFPWWDDLATGTTGNVRGLLTTVNGLDAYVVQWFVTMPRATSGAANATMQAVLYSTGRIDFIYGSGAGTGSASVGCTGLVATQFQSLSGAPNHTASITTASNSLTATNWPGTGRIYTFTPPVPCTTVAGGSAQASVASGCGSVASSTLSVTGSTTGVTGLTFQWFSGPPGGPYTTALGTGISQVVTSVGTTTAYVREITCTASGATATSSEVVITVTPSPVVSLSASAPGPFCGAANSILTASGATTYTWSPSTGLSTTTGPSTTTTATTSTLYTVTGTANGCNGTATFLAIVNPNPQISSVTASPNPICVNGSSQLNATASAALAYVTSTPAYSLEPCGSNAGPAGDDALLPATGIGFDFTYFGVNYSQFTISTNGNIQLGNGSGTVNNPFYSNAWTDVAIPNAALPNNFIALGWDDWNAAAGQITYGVTGSAPNRKLVVCFNNITGRGDGQSGTLNGQIVLEESTNAVQLNMTTINSTVAMTQGAEDQTGSAASIVVAGRNNAIWSASSGSIRFAPGAPDFLWSNTGGFLNDVSIPDPVASNVSATTEYTVTVTNPVSGCFSTGTVTLATSAPISAASISGTPAYCAGLSTTLTAVPADGGAPFSFLWSPGGEPTAAIDVNSPGTYSCQVTDNCGGSVSTSIVTVVENPLPVVSVNAPATTYCAPDAAVLTASGASTYSWSPVTGLNASTGTTVNATPSANTTYTVTGTDENGCTAQATVSVTSSTTPVVLGTTASPPIVCAGEGSTLAVNMGGTAPTDYCVVTNSTGCTFPDIITNVTFAGINRSSTCDNVGGVSSFFNSPQATVVAGNSYTISVTTGGDVEGAAAWIDYNQNGIFEPATEQLFSALAGTNPATYTFPVQIPANAVNGQTRIRVRCIYNANPNTLLNPPCTPVTWGETEDYLVNVSGGISLFTYSWTPDELLNDASLQGPTASNIVENTTYQVEVSNSAGCTATGTVEVTVNTNDTDGDGTIDCLDGCPTDAMKTSPGICGCGTPDADSDGDGTANCIDACPDDPMKIAPGICGCGVEDNDGDGDGTADCLDGCPFDPNKTSPGLCGCGITDSDVNNNGICDLQEELPLVQLGIAAITDSQMEIRLLPNSFFSGVLASSVVTIRWMTTPGVTVNGALASIADLALENAVGNVLYQGIATNGIYSYATFATFGTSSLQDEGLFFAANTSIPFFRVPYSNSTNACVEFEVVDDTYQEITNRSWYISLNGVESMNGYILGSASAEAAPAVACQNATVTLDNGAAVVTVEDINTSFVGCMDVLLSLDQTSFTCEDVGVNTVLLTANANGTITTCAATVTVISTLTADATEPVVNCTGGTAVVEVSATGGGAPYSGTGSFPMPPGPFTFVVTDVFGCTASASGTVAFELIDADGDGICDEQDSCPLVEGVIGTECNDGDPLTINDVLGPDCNCAGHPDVITLTLRTVLEGAYDIALGTMRDDLRQAGLLPSMQPYGNSPWSYAGTEGVGASVLATSGPNAIVDWVLVELRSSADPTVIVERRAALLQRDGDIVDVNGTGPVVFASAPGTFHIAIRHRNHLGIMTIAPLTMDYSTPMVDFSAPSTGTFGTEARNLVGTVAAMWAGNVAPDDKVKYTGMNNDRDPILALIGGIATDIITGYHIHDVTMDGIVRYAGAGNDREPILVNIGGLVPTLVRDEQLP
jgi:hypothetical protein